LTIKISFINRIINTVYSRDVLLLLMLKKMQFSSLIFKLKQEHARGIPELLQKTTFQN